MTFLLASAEQTDTSASGWFPILICLVMIAVAVVLTTIPIALARHRAHRQVEAITVLSLAWGVASGGSAVWIWLARVQWAKEYDLLIKTGYYDPANVSGAPAWPWALWIALAAVYVVLLLYSLAGGGSRPSGPARM